MDCLKLKNIILNTRKPLVMRSFGLKWKCFDITLQEWCKAFDSGREGPTLFEMMDCTDCNKSPQWERKRKEHKMTTTEFLEKGNATNDCWFGLNYQRAKDLPSAVKVGIELDSLGFPDVSEEITSWLCSKGANTPCHYDTYGCNIVIQIYGKKSWLLFPPDTPLSSTRIPYEESSVYCSENFFAPEEKEMVKLLNLKQYAYRCVLKAGDILIVPKHWWHYVEALEVSLSMNYWVPLLLDAESQIDECIVKFIIESFVKNEGECFKKFLLNPNQLQQIADEIEIFDIINYLHASVVKTESKESKGKRTAYPYYYMEENQLNHLLEELPKGLVDPVLQMTEEEYQGLILDHSKRLRKNCETSIDSQPISKMKTALINSICSPEVIKHIKQEFFKRYQI